jgi:hypothetical protein
MQPETQKLVEVLDDLAKMLYTYGVLDWGRSVYEVARRLRYGDLAAIREFLEAFGGMGSINDLVICPENGHAIPQSEVSAANERLGQSLSKAWSLAMACRAVEDTK